MDYIVRAGLDASEYTKGLSQMRNSARMATGEIGRGADQMAAKISGATAPLRAMSGALSGMLGPFGILIGLATSLGSALSFANAETERLTASSARARELSSGISGIGSGQRVQRMDPLSRDLNALNGELQRRRLEIYNDPNLTNMDQSRLITELYDEIEATKQLTYENHRNAESAQMRADANQRFSQAMAQAGQFDGAGLSPRERAVREYDDARAALADAESGASVGQIDMLREQRAQLDINHQAALARIDAETAKKATADAAQRAAEQRARQHADGMRKVELLRAQGRKEDADELQSELATVEAIAAIRRDDGRTEAEKQVAIDEYNALHALRGGATAQTRSVAAGTSAGLIERVLGQQGASAQTQQLRVVEIIQKEVARVAPLLTRIESTLAQGVPAVAG